MLVNYFPNYHIYAIKYYENKILPKTIGQKPRGGISK